MLAVVWFASSITGAVFLASALTVRSRRAPLLRCAGAAFVVAGLLGILSIGILFLAAAAVCFRLARRPAAR